MAQQLSPQDAAKKAVERFTRSKSWMESNFYGEWEKVFQQYNCSGDVIGNKNNESGQVPYYKGLFSPTGNVLSPPDKDQTDLVTTMLPDQWGLIRRKVARATGNIPNLSYHSEDQNIARNVSRTIMWQWDKSRAQRQQKKHVTSAFLFGLSVKSWYWEKTVINSYQRVNPHKADPRQKELIAAQYGDEIAMITRELNPTQDDYLREPESVESAVINELLARFGKGVYLKLDMTNIGYVGPKFDVISLADFYPEPEFQSIQSASWICITRKRKKGWLADLVRAYDPNTTPQEDGYGVNVDQVESLVKEQPKGGTWIRSSDGLRQRMTDVASVLTADNYSTSTRHGSWIDNADEDDAEYVILEVHSPGKGCVEYIAEEKYYLGKVKYPFDLEDGMVPLTDLVFVDSLLHGVGDSSARKISPLVDIHSHHNSLRYEAVKNVLRPFKWTSDRRFYDNPSLLDRGLGFRLLLLQGPNEIGDINEPAALASIASSMNDESSIMRTIQYGTGESNMSMLANVDPAQNKTATGAKIAQQNQDVLSKEELEMLNLSLFDDLEMMRQLNKSELTDELRIDESPYARANRGEGPSWLTIMPEDFQGNGTVIPEVGSTLADDDDSNVNRAMMLYQEAKAAPQLLNIEKARDGLLIAMGEGKNIQSWIPQPPQIPPEKMQSRAQFNVSVKLETLPPDAQQMILQEILVPKPVGGPGGPVDEGGGGGGVGGPGAEMPIDPAMSPIEGMSPEEMMSMMEGDGGGGSGGMA